MSGATFEQAAHAAELVGLAVYARAVLARAIEHEPAVVSLRLSCTLESSGLQVIEAEFVDSTGQAHGGFGL